MPSKLLSFATELGTFGAEITVSRSDEELSRAGARQKQFRLLVVDLILLDWVMPRMDGLALLKRLKSHERLAGIPVLMVTSVAEETKIGEALRAGVDGYLLKPFTKEMLLRAIVSLAPGKPEIMDESVVYPEDEKPERGYFLQGLELRYVGKIMDAADVVETPGDQTVLAPGQAVEKFLFVVEGLVSESLDGATDNGKVLRSYGPGECFGVVELMSGDPAAHEFRTRVDSKIGCLERRDFEKLLLTYPEVGVTLSQFLAAKSQDVRGQDRAEDGALSGSLEILDIPDLVQALSLRQVTGTIELPGVDSRIEVSAGQIVCAVSPDCPTEDGRAAFFRIVDQRPARFRFMSGKLSGRCNIQQNTTSLLLQCMQWLDEKDLQTSPTH